MSRIISIEFIYQGNAYHALVRCMTIDGLRQVRVTIMNGELEAKLSGHHIFHIGESGLLPAKPCSESAVLLLQSGLLESLEHSTEFSELYNQFYAPVQPVA